MRQRDPKVTSQWAESEVFPLFFEISAFISSTIKAMKVEGLIERSGCVLTQNRDLEFLHSFKDFPIFMGCTSRPLAEDLHEDMNWFISRSSGVIQLNPLIPPEILYANAHNEALGGVWTQHHAEFSAFISQFKPKSIIEMGGANALLAKNYLKQNPTAEWTLVDPNAGESNDLRIRKISGFVDSRFRVKGSFDAIVQSHLFEHLYQPSEFMESISNQTRTGQYLFFSIPNMRSLLSQSYLNCLNFEHTVFLDDDHICSLLKRSDFEILEKKHFMDHSIFYAAVKTTKRPQPPFSNLYDQNKKMFLNFIDTYSKWVSETNKRIVHENLPIWLFGGHIFSQFLISFGLNTSKVHGILDNGQLKIGKRLYGTSFSVESPQILKGKGPAIVILKAASYNTEIKRQILETVNDQVIFWE
ncbi:MAG: Methyltransferase [Bacteriovoracaceae bacterium]|nr:Methyltransferase [Bacteriovoracaceae bacterium]